MSFRRIAPLVVLAGVLASPVAYAAPMSKSGEIKSINAVKHEIHLASGETFRPAEDLRLQEAEGRREGHGVLREEGQPDEGLGGSRQACKAGALFHAPPRGRPRFFRERDGRSALFRFLWPGCRRSLFAADFFGARFDFVEQGGEPLRHRDGGIVQQCAPSASDRSCQREVNCAHRPTRHKSWSHHGSFSRCPEPPSKVLRPAAHFMNAWCRQSFKRRRSGRKA